MDRDAQGQDLTFRRLHLYGILASYQRATSISDRTTVACSTPLLYVAFNDAVAYVTSPVSRFDSMPASDRVTRSEGRSDTLPVKRNIGMCQRCPAYKCMTPRVLRTRGVINPS